jgi:hypothetical protein
MPASGDMCPKGWCALAGERQTLALHGPVHAGPVGATRKRLTRLMAGWPPGPKDARAPYCMTWSSAAAHEPAMERAAGQLGSALARGALQVIKQRQRMPPDLNDNASSSSAKAGLRGRAGLIG